MHISEWRQELTINKAKGHKQVICITPPFLEIPGLMEQIFPNATIKHVSLVPRPNAASPALTVQKISDHRVPLLSLHLGLVEAYWSTRERWKPWIWLERDFAVLEAHGFRFERGSIDGYRGVVEIAASQFVDWLITVVKEFGATAIATYGRGHWTMNSADVVCSQLCLPLYVVERGVLPDTYIIDSGWPFTAVCSTFRCLWNKFRSVHGWEPNDLLCLSESRSQLYCDLLSNRTVIGAMRLNASNVAVGQCMFDYNCLNAPFRTPLEFVEYVCDLYPELLQNETLLYRPHPLSPEEYPDGSIHTKHGAIPVDLSKPWERLRTKPVLYTWNSTLGLEAAMVFGLGVNILDPQCHYVWVKHCTDADKELYIGFLNEVSVPSRRGNH